MRIEHRSRKHALICGHFFIITSLLCGNNSMASDAHDFQHLLELHNTLRAAPTACGKKSSVARRPLKWNNKLAKAATLHAAYLAKKKRLSHKGVGGSTAGQRIDRAGYRWQSYAENIAQGQTSIDSVMQGWANSAQHCKNIIRSNLNELGAAVKDNYWVVVMAQSQR